MLKWSHISFNICKFCLHNMGHKMVNKSITQTLQQEQQRECGVHPCLYKWPSFVPFCGRVIFHCIYVSHLFCPFICRQMSRLLLCLGYCKKCCYKHWGACVFLNYGFLNALWGPKWKGNPKGRGYMYTCG